MTEITARQALVASGYTAEERRLARCRLLQRLLFPGDGRLIGKTTEAVSSGCSGASGADAGGHRSTGEGRTAGHG